MGQRFVAAALAGAGSGCTTHQGGAMPTSAGSASDPVGGSVVLNTDGSFTYTPDPGFAGTGTFIYTASDGAEGSTRAPCGSW